MKTIYRTFVRTALLTTYLLPACNKPLVSSSSDAPSAARIQALESEVNHLKAEKDRLLFERDTAVADARNILESSQALLRADSKESATIANPVNSYEVQAREIALRYFLRKGDSWFNIAPLGVERYLKEYRGLTVEIKEKTSKADLLNGYEWKGSAEVHWSADRIYGADNARAIDSHPGKWSSAEGAILDLDIVRQNGKWSEVGGYLRDYRAPDSSKIP